MLRLFTPSDAQAVNELVQAAYSESERVIPAWSEFKSGLGALVGQAEHPASPMLRARYGGPDDIS